VIVKLLDSSCNRKNFTCEEVSLTNYIREQAGQDVRKRLTACFVSIDNDNNVIGYYTLSSESLGRELIPDKYLKHLPQNYNAPLILLGRLARDLRLKGAGLGEYLLMDALFRSFKLSNESIGAMAVVVDPINEKAIEFYGKYGFELLVDSGKMFLPMKVIGQLL